VPFVLAFLTLLAASEASAQVPITLYQSFAGNIDFTGTGNTLRAQSDAVNPCAVIASSSAPLTVPGGVTVQNAFLYWAGSGSVVDSTVTFGGQVVNADRTFTETFPYNGTDYDFFAGFANVTALVSGSGLYTFSGLTVNTGAPHCGVSAVLSGWQLLVIYELASEPLRVINLYDGFRYFRGSTITLMASNFQIPPAPFGTGRHAHLTWEGDSGNSGPLGGVVEALVFDGNTLTDALNPANNQFNSTVNVTGSTTSWGVDLDLYDITPYLSAGQTLVSTDYSSGGDLVLLSGELFSVPNVDTTDLAVTKTHVGDFTVGQNHDFAITTTNYGPSDASSGITVTDTLPAGLSYVSGTGTGWSCSAAGQDVSCQHSGNLTSGSSHPPITLTVSVGAAAYPSVVNTATVSGPEFDHQPANDSDSDTVTVLASDLSTSTKTVVDLNGGDAVPGDILRYTVTLTESGGANAPNVSVTDDIPANVNGFTVTSIPPGATNSSTGAGTGANLTGFLNVTGVAVAASGTASITFEVTIDAAATPGTVISNTAIVTNPDGPGASPAAPDVIVSASSIPGAGEKWLYLYDSTSVPPFALSRIPSAAQNLVEINGGGASQNWTLTPAVVAPLIIDAQNVPVDLYLTERGPGSNRDIAVTLTHSGGIPIGTVAQRLSLTGVPVLYTFTVPNAILHTVVAGQTLTLTITNLTGNGNRRIRVHPTSGGGNSRVRPIVNTVINVDSVEGYDAAFAGGSVPASFTPGETVFIRAAVSDPFGDFDITGAQLVLLDSLGSTVVGPVAMTRASAVGVHPRIYEYSHALAADAATGVWTARVTATEGTEGTLFDLGIGTFEVQRPLLMILKSMVVLDDPSGASAPNAKAIPGANAVYTIRVTNTGRGKVDLDSLVITDSVPAGLEFWAADFDGSTSGPIRFDDSAPASGLTYTFIGLGSALDDVDFQGPGPGWGYTPVPVSGYDGAVSAIRINPKGVMNGAGAANPYFEVRFKARVR